MVMPLTALVGWLWPVAENLRSCSLPPPYQQEKWENRKNKSKKTSESRWTELKRQEKFKWYKCNHSASHKQAPSNSHLRRQNPTSILHYVISIAERNGEEYLFAHFWSAVPSMTFPNSLFRPLLRWVGCVRVRKKSKSSPHASTVQHQPKHCCVINAVLATNTKHSTCCYEESYIPIPARPSTPVWANRFCVMVMTQASGCVRIYTHTHTCT